MALGSTQHLIGMSASDISWCRTDELFRARAQIVYKFKKILSFFHGDFEEQNKV